MAKTKETEAVSTSELSKNLLGSMLVGYKETHYNGKGLAPTRISTGSLILDSYIKLMTGTTIRMGGPAEVGKTSEAMLIADNYMKTISKSKAIYINAEAKFGPEIQARTGMKFTEDPAQWDYGTVFIFQTNVFDTVCDTLEALLRQMYDNGEYLCIIIDSVDMLRLASTLKKSATDNKKPAGVNFLTKEMFRRISHEVHAYNALMIMITQYSAVFNLDPYTKEAPQLMEGNNTHALNHQAAYALYYRPRNRKDYILTLADEKAPPDREKNPIRGVNVKIDLRKTSTDETGVLVEIPIKRGRVGNCVWTEKEAVDMALIFGLITKKGAGWFSFEETLVAQAKKEGVEIVPKIQGIDVLYDYFENNKPVCDWFLAKIKRVIS